MDDSTNKAIYFVDYLLELGLISKDQANLLVEYIMGAFPSYKNNEELSKKYAEIALLLAEHTKSVLDAAETSKDLPPEFFEKLKELPQVEFDMANPAKLYRGKHLNLLKEIGLFEQLKNKNIAIRTNLSLFFPTLGRLVYSAMLIQRLTTKATHKFSLELQKIVGKAKSLPQDAKDKLCKLSIDTSRYLMLNEYRLTGNMKDKINIYESGPVYYTSANQSLFVFASTSGLVIPTEYTGEIDRQYLRKSYFENGFFGEEAKLLQRYYQWDRRETAIELYKGYKLAYENGQEDLFISQSANNLARAFADPYVELTTSDFNELGAGMAHLKKSMTLSCANVIIKTNRDKDTNHIATAITMDGTALTSYLQGILPRFTSRPILPQWSRSIADAGKNSSMTFSEVIYEYIYRAGRVTTVKKMGQKLGKKDAVELIKQEIFHGEHIYHSVN